MLGFEPIRFEDKKRRAYAASTRFAVIVYEDSIEVLNNKCEFYN